MKFIHTADIHLDSPLVGLEHYDGAPVAELRSATRKAFVNLVAMAKAEAVSFVLIAGDIYDGDWRDYNTGLFFAHQMARLSEANIRVFLVRGNHDADSQITRELKLPGNVHVFQSRKPETVVCDDLGVAIHGQSFAHQTVTDDLSAAYPVAIRGLFNIGLLHTSANGREGHETYAPCAVPGLLTKGYDYWALGHVHQRETLAKEPWIVFPGNIQGRHIRETGPKGCDLVTVKDGHVTAIETRALDVARWCECVVACAGASDLNDVLDRVRTALQQVIAKAEDRLVATRVIARGACRAHGSLKTQNERFVNECRALATELGSGRIWVEKALIETRAAINLDELAARADPIGQLLQYCRQLSTDEAAIAELLAEFKDLNQKLPLPIRQGADALNLNDPQFLRELLPEIEQELAPRLLQQE
ncbi:MAG: DNA repair exonuclease [Planctomycetota bacterium]